ncbi:hypothetical protein RAL01_004395 [Vibrio vulnificus]|uniref:hypothetical protein n=1 Tax=Vibrio vulnificus TaxID=672 RepID=UPI001A180ACA|nr:hypothetical protein [Vibrio vulnificus]EHU9455840.1 hypothetical protein [Vibrio vulnificus]EJN6713682.1 hypothetical protein [Vibrio vulnificus]ELG4952062.1 hypothetical protein [Vibrio vulnificus]MCA3958078.1 hypothetical protein [Vibrio vulnificus]MCU8483489.1 hypothetical protein [Vibrio vulnificus]
MKMASIKVVSNSLVAKVSIVSAIVGASLCVGGSLYETRVLRYDMFGDVFPALIFGTIGGIVGGVIGVVTGVILKHFVE